MPFLPRFFNLSRDFANVDRRQFQASGKRKERTPTRGFSLSRIVPLRSEQLSPIFEAPRDSRVRNVMFSLHYMSCTVHYVQIGVSNVKCSFRPFRFTFGRSRIVRLDYGITNFDSLGARHSSACAMVIEFQIPFAGYTYHTRVRYRASFGGNEARECSNKIGHVESAWPRQRESPI